MKQVLFFCFMLNTLLFAKCDTVDRSRFTLMGEHVYDKKTQLMWMRCSVGSQWKEGIGCQQMPKLMSFYEAKEVESGLKSQWRIPTIEELETIFLVQCEKDAINTTLFPDIKHLEGFAPYWSTTSVKQLPNLIYYIDFIDKNIDAHSKGFSMFLRLVKDNESHKQ